MWKAESPYSFQGYKPYLNHVLSPTGSSRGLRSKLAEHLDCQTAFISQVLNGPSHFSLEYALKISEFLSHNEDEAQFFMLLVQMDRAGTHTLKDFYKRQLQQIHTAREKVQERIKVKQGLSEQARETYYSSWHYA